MCEVLNAVPVCPRDPDTQVALLDRIAGSAAAAARFGSRLRRLRALEAEAAQLAALGGAKQRAALQAMVDQVCCYPSQLTYSQCITPKNYVRHQTCACLQGEQCQVHKKEAYDVAQVYSANLEPGEERQLRRRLRRMTERRAAVERCGLVR